MNKSILKNPGTLILLALVLVALFADVLSPYPQGQRFEPHGTPNWQHILGTNDLGNDIFGELVHGTRVSLMVGFTTAFIATVLGLLIGLPAGYYKGFMDEVLMGLTDIFLMIPRIPLLIVLAAILKPGALTIALLLGILWWPATARVTRSKTLQIREMAFIQSAECIGHSHSHIMFSEILPNVREVIHAKFLINFATSMLAEASISFLGLGDPMVKSWGRMINTAFTEGGVINKMWWWYLPPGICITLTVLSVMFIGLSLEKTGKKPLEEDLLT